MEYVTKRLIKNERSDGGHLYKTFNEPTGRGDDDCNWERDWELVRPFPELKLEDEVEDGDSSCMLLFAADASNLGSMQPVTVVACMGPEMAVLCFSVSFSSSTSLPIHASAISFDLKYEGMGVVLISTSLHIMPFKAPHALTAEAEAFSAIRVTALTLLPLVLHLAVSTCNADDERRQEGTGGKETERVRR